MKILKICYNTDGKTLIDIIPGKIYELDDVETIPIFDKSLFDPNFFYTLIMINFDENEGVSGLEKSIRKVYPINWLLVNINLGSEETGIPYYAPLLNLKTKRYFFFLFKQKQKVNMMKEFLVITRDSDRRYYFDILNLFQLSENYMLVASNYFFLRNSYVIDNCSNKFEKHNLSPIFEDNDVFKFSF